MLTIEFRRFVPDTTSLNKTSSSFTTLVFNVTLDHTTISNNQECPIYCAKKIASHWLKNHYGIIDIFAVGGSFNKIHLKFSNKRKFLEDMIKEDLLPIVKDPEHSFNSKDANTPITEISFYREEIS